MSKKKLKVGILNLKESLFEVFLKSFRNLGHEVEILALDQNSWQDCQAWMNQGQFDFFLMGNYLAFDTLPFGKELEKYLEDSPLPLIVWHWEKVFFSGRGYLKEKLKQGPLSKNILFFVTDKADVEILKSYRVPVFHLPLAVDDALKDFRPRPQLPGEFSPNLSFTGTPFFAVKPVHLDEGGLAYDFTCGNLLDFYKQGKAQAGLVPPSKEIHDLLLENLFSFYKVLYSNFSAMNRGLETLVLSWKPLLNQEALHFFERGYHYRIAYIYSYFQLTVYLQRLRKFDLRVFGSESWMPFFKEYPHEIPRLTDEEFYSLLAASKITFCLTKLQFQSFVHERPMMTLACGGFPITDYREEIPEMFEKDELIFYRSYEEAEDLIAYYLKHDEERLKISRKGQARVLRCHTYSKRIEKMLEDIHQHFGI